MSGTRAYPILPNALIRSGSGRQIFLTASLMLRSSPRRTPLLSKRLSPVLRSVTHQQSLRRIVMVEALPPLSREDRDTYGRMGTTMEWFHNNFRNTWKVLYGACSSGKRPANMSIRQFLNTGSEFAHHLTMHHTIGMSKLLGLTMFSVR